MTIADADHLQAKRSPRAGVVNGRRPTLERRFGRGRPSARRALDRARVWLAQRSGPPRVLMHSSAVNVEILRAFGAHVGDRVRVHAPVVLHEAERGFSNLSLGDGCLLNGNNFIDLSGRVTLEPGVSLGPGVTVMTHNRFNYNSFLEGALAHQCGVRDIVFERGAGIKAGAIVVMGVTVGQCSVVAAGAVVNRDVPPYGLVAGIPAREIQRARWMTF